MWPKALFEILPHVARLLPMADKFFASKSANEESNKRALDAMTEGLRGDLGQVTAAHAGLYRQLNDIDAKLVTVALDTAATRTATADAATRITTLEHRQDRTGLLLLIITALLLLNLAFLLYLRLHDK